MKAKIYLSLLLLVLMLAFSCKKDKQQAQSVTQQKQAGTLAKDLTGIAIVGQLQDAFIDTLADTVTIVIPDTLNIHKLTVKISLSAQVTAVLKTTTVTGNITGDFSQPVTLTITSVDKALSTSFKINVETASQYIGIGGSIISGKSLNRGYNFYFDQFDGSIYQSINCGPAVSTMAIKWADSAFAGKPIDARNTIQPQGNLWSTADMQNYLALNNVATTVDTLKNIDSLVKTNINNNDLIILCLNMVSVPLNTVNYQHVSKFYLTGGSSWGHFLLVKGYKQIGSIFYLEIYDPYSQREYYPGFDAGQLKGKDRYYVDNYIRFAVSSWWPYVIIVSPGAQKSTGSTKLTVNSLGKHVPIAFGQ